MMNKDIDRSWQLKFYNSKRWRDVRNAVRIRDLGICQHCGELIVNKKWIVDHIIEIDNSNMNNWNILYNMDNLQLLCITCHNKKTFKKSQIKREYDYSNRNGILDKYR